MSVRSAIVVPHPPMIIPMIGHGDERKIETTLESYRLAAKYIKETSPDIVVILTASDDKVRDFFQIYPGSEAFGDFEEFGAKSLKINVNYNAEFIHALCEEAKHMEFPAKASYSINPKLDYKSLVPIYFLKEVYGRIGFPNIVRINTANLPEADHYRMGMLIRDTANLLGFKVSIIASADFSGKINPDSPSGYSPDGKQYDVAIGDILETSDFSKLFDFSKSFTNKAGATDHNVLLTMAGCFDRMKIQSAKASYEDTLGVGYGVFLHMLSGKDDDRNYLEQYYEKISEEELLIEQQNREEEEKESVKETKNDDFYIKLAKFAVETYVSNGRLPKVPLNIPIDMMDRRAGVFVSIFENGLLRGCIGTITPESDSVAQEIISNAALASTSDKRFNPVHASEFKNLSYVVDVVTNLEKIKYPSELDIDKYGLVVTRGLKKGVLLPRTEGIRTVSDQIKIAKERAGIKFSEDVILHRFEVEHHG